MKEEKYSTIKAREWRKRNPEQRKAQRKAYSDNHPEKVVATKAIEAAVRKGLLPRVTNQACANPECNENAQQYHHWSYEPENYLNVLPLCIECHTAIHHGILRIESPDLLAVSLKRGVRRKGKRVVMDDTADSRTVDELIKSSESVGFTRENIKRLAALADLWGIRVKTDGKTVVILIIPDGA